MKLHQLFFFLFLLLLPTQLGYHFWPDWAFVLGRRIDYLSPTLYLTDILVIFILGSWIIDRLHYKFSIFLINQRKYKFLILELIALVFFIGINIFFAASRPVAVYKWFKVLEFIALGGYVYKTKPPLAKVTFFLSLGVIYSSGLAIVQFFLQRSLGGIFWFLGERTFNVDTPGIARFESCQLPVASLPAGEAGCQLWLRPYATFPHPNVLGGYLAALLPLIIIQLSNYPIVKLSNRKNLFYLSTIAFGIIALGLTFSRSAWIVGALGASIMYYVLRQRKQIFYFPLILNAVVLILLVLFVFTSFKPEEESVVVREELNRAAIMMWQSSPLLGVGLGNFLIALPKTLPTRTVYFLQPVHNIYLLVLAETGLVGLVVFLWPISRLVKGLVSSIKYLGSNHELQTMTYKLTFVSLLLLGLVDHYFLTLQQGQLLLILFLALSL